MEGESIISLFGKVVKGDEAAFRLLFETYSLLLSEISDNKVYPNPSIILKI